MIGLVASFFTIIFAYGRNTYSLSRAGYFPKFLSMTHGKRKTPHVALIAGAVVGYVGRRSSWYLLQQRRSGATDRGGAAEHGGVRGGDLVHRCRCISFILLRRKLPNIERPYRSPWGVAGAVIAGVIAVVSLVSIFLNEAYRPGVYGVAVVLRPRRDLYFAIAGRHRLVLSPEEEFALTAGRAGRSRAGGVRARRRRSRRRS